MQTGKIKWLKYWHNAYNMHRERNKLWKLLQINLLDKYIIKQFIGTFLFSLAIFVLIVVVFDISENLDQFIKNNITAKQMVFDYYLNFALYYASLLSPLIIFISVIFFTAKLANNTEIVAMLSGGLSYNRLMYPYFLGALLLAIVTFVFNGYIIPQANKSRFDFENTHIHKRYEFNKRNLHFQLDTNTLVYLESYTVKHNVGYLFTLERIENGELRYKLMSNRIYWNQDTEKWTIEQYSIRTIDGLDESFVSGSSLDTTLAMTPADFERKDNYSSTMNMRELNEYIEREIIRGTGDVAQYQIEKYRRYSSPFATFILTLIGVSLAAKKVRGGVGLPLGIGIACSFAYIVLIQFSTVFAVKGGLPPLLAVWIPNIIFGTLALYLYKIAPK